MIEEDDHVLIVLRYIEGHPLRAPMVTTLAGYPWSSYLVYGLGKSDPLLTHLPVWDTLGKDDDQRQGYWRDWVHTPLTERELAAVRHSLVSGKPFGNSTWTEQ